LNASKNQRKQSYAYIYGIRWRRDPLSTDIASCQLFRRVRNIAVVICIYLKRCGRLGASPVMPRHFEADACSNKFLLMSMFILEGSFMTSEEQAMESHLRKQISEEVSRLLSGLVKDSYERCNDRAPRRDFDFHQAQAQAYETARMLVRSLIEKELH
jgi:hypothetical protein